jgi:hypothetical protein
MYQTCDHASLLLAAGGGDIGHQRYMKILVMVNDETTSNGCLMNAVMDCSEEVAWGWWQQWQWQQ